AEGGRRPGVGAHRIPPARPVVVADQAAGQRMPQRHDAVQVAHLALEAAGGEGERGDAGHGGVAVRQPQAQLGAPVGRGRGEQVGEAEPGGVLVGADQGEPVAGGEQFARPVGQLVRGDVDRGDGGGHGVPPAASAAASSRGCSGPRVTPSAAQSASPATSGTAALHGGRAARAAPSACAGAGAGSGRPKSMPKALRLMAAAATATSSSATTAAHPYPAVNPARTMPSSLAKTLNGGRPSSAARPRAKVPATSGARPARPRTASVRLLPVSWRMCPEPRNSTDLPRPW